MVRLAKVKFYKSVQSYKFTKDYPPFKRVGKEVINNVIEKHDSHPLLRMAVCI